MTEAHTCPKCAATGGNRVVAGIFNGDPHHPIGISMVVVPCSHEHPEDKIIYETDRYTPVNKKPRFRLATLDGVTLPEPETPPQTVQKRPVYTEKVYADAPVPLPKPKERPSFLKIATVMGENVMNNKESE